MRAYLKENFQFLIMYLIWVVVGISFSPAAMVLIPLTVLLLYMRGYEIEVFIGFLFVLTMSDSRVLTMYWAADVKNIYILLFSLIALRHYRKDQLKIRLHMYLMPFLAVAGFCLFFSPDVNKAVQKTLSYGLLFFSVPNYFSYLYKKYGNDFLVNIVWTIFLLLLVGFGFRLIGSDVASLAGRYRGILGNPNGLGIYCFLFMVFFAIINEFFPSLFTRNEKLLIYFFSGLSLILCGARSSLLALIIFFAFRYFHRLSPIIAFMILVSVAGTYELITTNIESIIRAFGIEEFARIETLKDGSGRLVAWAFAWENINKNFFIGRGFYYTEYLYLENLDYLSALGHQGSAHNAYLTFWLDTGLVGLVAFATGFLSFMLSIAKLSVSLLPLIYAVLFSNQFESWLTASLNPFTIMFLSSVSLIYIAGTERKHSMKNDTETDQENSPAIAA